MARLALDVAQQIEDDFNQTFRPANAFFTLEDFALKAVQVRDSELEREFLIQYQQNKTSFPVINPMWLDREKVPVKKDEEGNWYADVCTPIYELPMDSRGAGIQDVKPFGNSCAEFVRITNQQQWQICMLPPTNQNFYSIEKCRIWLHNFYGCTDSLNVVLVPSQSGKSLDQQTIPDGKVASVIEVVLNSMWRNYQIKLGKISVHGDGNPNPNPNETSMVYQDLKTK